MNEGTENEKHKSTRRTTLLHDSQVTSEPMSFVLQAWRAAAHFTRKVIYTFPINSNKLCIFLTITVIPFIYDSLKLCSLLIQNPQ